MANLLAFVGLCALLAVTHAVLPDNYASLSAREKQALQWNQVLATRYNLSDLPTDFPEPGANLNLLAMPEYLAKSFLLTGDEMINGRRRMLLSPFSLVCKVEYHTFKNSTSHFTGLFHSGGIGLIRLSLDAIYGGVFGSLYSPTAAIKVYIDGDISRNFQHIKDVIGQGENKNFFLNSMSNIMDKGPNDPQAVFDAFIATIAILPGDALSRPLNPYTLGLYEQATINSDGTNVTGKIVAPWEHILTPHPGRHTDLKSTKDFRVELSKAIKIGEPLYDVYAKRSLDGQRELIGQIVPVSECVPSKYGDEMIFFRQSVQQWRL